MTINIPIYDLGNINKAEKLEKQNSLLEFDLKTTKNLLHIEQQKTYALNQALKHTSNMIDDQYAHSYLKTLNLEKPDDASLSYLARLD